MAKWSVEEEAEPSQEESEDRQDRGGCPWARFPHFFKLKIKKYNSFSLEVALIALLRLAPALHALVAYLLLSPSHAAPLRAAVGALSGGGAVSVVAQGALYALKACEIFAVWTQGKGGEGWVVGGAGQRIMRNLNILVEADLALSAFLLLGSFGQHFAGFFVAALLYAFNALFLVNYFDRRDVLYFSSINSNLFLTSLTLLSFVTNSLFAQWGSLALFTFADLLLSGLLFTWYMKDGFLLVPHSTFRLLLEWTVIVKAAVSLLFLDYFFLPSAITILSLGGKAGLLCAVIYSCCHIWQSQLRLFEALLLESSPASAKRFDTFLGSLAGPGTDCERENFIMGMLSRDGKSHTYKLYDQRSQTVVPSHEATRETELQAELRRLYRCALERFPGEAGLVLDYCEFVLNEFNNVFEVSQWAGRLRAERLGLLEQLRLARLREILQESNVAFNAVVFEGRMDLEHMILAEATFEEITVGVEAAIALELEIWRAIGAQTVNMTEVRGLIERKLALLAESSSRWATIAKYLRLQKRWRYIFMNYSFFLLNERLYYKDTDEFRNFTEDNYFLGESAHLAPADPRDRLYSQALLFDKKAFYIRARLTDATLLVTSVSRSFANFVEYSQAEIVGSPVHLLMPEEFKWTHDERVLGWLGAGSCAAEEQYAVRFTSFLTKNGEEVPAVKYFKLFVDVNDPGLLEFVCLLKANQPDLPPDCQEQSEALTERTVGDQAIRRDFSTTKQSNLRLENNIFMKEEGLRTNGHIKEIEQAKKAIRLLTASLVGLVVALLLLSRRDTATVEANIVQFLNFLNLYRFPMALGKNYMKNFLNVGNQASVTSQIISQTQNVLAFNSDPLTLKTLFDPALNAPASYAPFLNDSFNRGLSYDQVEIYSIVISSIMSLGRLPINRTGYDFAMLNMYLVPSYDHMINATKIRFHHTFRENLARMLADQLLVAAAETVLFAAIVLFVGMRIARYFRKGRSVMQIVFEFSELNVKRVQRYWKNLLKHFQKLHIRNKVYCMETTVSLRATQKMEIDLDIEIIRLKLQKEQNISCNKQEKRVFETKKARGRVVRAIVAIAAALLLLILGLLSIEVSNILQIGRLQAFEGDGFYFLQYYPATSVLGHALMERYYYQVKPGEVRYRAERYAEYISAVYLIGQSVYLGPPPDSASPYYQKQKNYMFGNPCTFAPQVLAAANSNLTACTTGFNRTLSLGITSFLRAVHPVVEDYLNLKINLTVPQLNDITTTLTIVAYYVTDAITTWTGEFRQQVEEYERLNTLLCVVAAGVILLLHLVFCEKVLFYFLESDYQFVREVFDKMVPNFIVSVEKVIRQKFVMEGIINQG